MIEKQNGCRTEASMLGRSRSCGEQGSSDGWGDCLFN